MQNFTGAMEYLCSWQWKTESLIQTAGGMVFNVSGLPFSVDASGNIEPIAPYAEGAAVLPSDYDVFEYIMKLAKRDLQYRGMRDDRLSCFHFKTEANFLLYRKVRDCTDAVEYAYLQQCWDTINRPKYQHRKWSKAQASALAKIDDGISYDDEGKKVVKLTVYDESESNSITMVVDVSKAPLNFENRIKENSSTILLLILISTGGVFLSIRYRNKEDDKTTNNKLKDSNLDQLFDSIGSNKSINYADMASDTSELKNNHAIESSTLEKQILTPNAILSEDDIEALFEE